MPKAGWPGRRQRACYGQYSCYYFSMVMLTNCVNCGREFRAKFKRGAHSLNCSKACGYATKARYHRVDWRVRFWAKVARSSDMECWLWTAAKSSFGYGVFAMDGSHDLRGAHRVSWFLHHGEWPADCLLHACDNPACVNPHHLREGSRAENMADKVIKGRQPRGTATGRSKLVEADVIAIRRSPLSQAELGRRYGVHRVTVFDILKGKTWKHLL